MTSLKYIRDFVQIMSDETHAWGYNSVIKSFTLFDSGCDICFNTRRKQKAMLKSQTESFVLCCMKISQSVRLFRYSSSLCNFMPLQLKSCNFRSAKTLNISESD